MEIPKKFACSIATIARKSIKDRGIKHGTVRWSMKILMRAPRQHRQLGLRRHQRSTAIFRRTTITISSYSKFLKCHRNRLHQKSIKSTSSKMSRFLRRKLGVPWISNTRRCTQQLLTRSWARTFSSRYHHQLWSTRRSIRTTRSTSNIRTSSSKYIHHQRPMIPG